VAEVQFFGVSLPPAPANLAGQLVEGVTSLTWNSAAFAGSYNVKRATAIAGPYTTIATNHIPVNYTDSGLSLGVTYYYVVSAVNEAGEGPDSTPIQVSDAYYGWAQQNGITPGSPGSAFNADFDSDGVQNGSEYMSPKGLSVTQTGPVTTVLAEIRIDPAIAVLLQSSVNLVTWSPLSFSVAADQSNVPGGFRRMILQESVAAGVTAKFYRLRFSR
jgi:hypothetical protein